MLEFSLQYVSQASVKGQVLADIFAEHQCKDVKPEYGIRVGMVEVNQCTIMFNVSKTYESRGIRVVLISLDGEKYHFAYQLDFTCSNNQAEYKALIKSLKIP